MCLDSLNILVTLFFNTKLSAIKTGRYTHQKRTRDTLEVKSTATTDHSDEEGHPNKVSATPSTTLSPSYHQSTSTSGGKEQPTSKERQSSSASKERIARPVREFSEETVALSERIITAFRRYFRDTTYIYEHLGEVEAMIDDILAQDGLTEIETVITVEGDGADCEVKTIKKITEQVMNESR